MSGRICINCHSEEPLPCESDCPRRDAVDARAFFAGLKQGYGNAAEVALMMKPDAQRIQDTLIDLADTTVVPHPITDRGR